MTGNQLKHFRQLKNLTQAELADRLNVATITIQRNERAERVSRRLKNQLKTVFPDLSTVIVSLANLTFVTNSVNIK